MVTKRALHYVPVVMRRAFPVLRCVVVIVTVASDDVQEPHQAVMVVVRRVFPIRCVFVVVDVVVIVIITVAVVSYDTQEPGACGARGRMTETSLSLGLSPVVHTCIVAAVLRMDDDWRSVR